MSSYLVVLLAETYPVELSLSLSVRFTRFVTSLLF